MTKDDIIRMAREAGCVDPMVFFGTYERFAALVAAALRDEMWEKAMKLVADAVASELEACAKVCDARYMGDNNREDMEARRCAEAIRARGQA